MGGVSLIELMLALGVAAAGTAIILGLAVNTRATAQRDQAHSDIRAFQARLISGYSASAGYILPDRPLDTESAKQDGLFPPQMLDPITGEPITPWGGAVLVSGTTRAGRPDNSSVVITMEDVPARDCVPLASSLAAGFSEVVVNQVSVGAGQGLDVGRLGEACAGRGGNLIQLYWDDPHAHEDLGTCLAGGDVETEVLECPGGQLGAITMQRLFSCPTAYEDAIAGPWTQTSNTCAPACELPTPNPQTETRPGGSCPVGYLGIINESRTATYTCPAPTGSPTIDYSPWTESENTCAPVCVAPPPQPASQTLECPSGQLGQIVQEQTTTWTCPAATGLPTSDTTPWVTTVNTCAPVCVAPPPQTNSRAVDCPAGQWGTIEQEQITTWTCPAPTGLPNPQTTDWTTTANTCAACPAPSSEAQTDWEARSKACPSGQSGSHTWEEQRHRTRSVSYDCPAGTTSLPSPTHGGWSGWSWTETKRGERNTCAPSCSAPARSYGTNRNMMVPGTHAAWSCSGLPITGVITSGVRQFTGGPVASQGQPAERDYYIDYWCEGGSVRSQRTYYGELRPTGPFAFTNTCGVTFLHNRLQPGCPSGWNRNRFIPAHLPDRHYQTSRQVASVNNINATEIRITSIPPINWQTTGGVMEQEDAGGTCAPCNDFSATFDCSGRRR